VIYLAEKSPHANTEAVSTAPVSWSHQAGKLESPVPLILGEPPTGELNHPHRQQEQEAEQRQARPPALGAVPPAS
jgi:hypothetical protein